MLLVFVAALLSPMQVLIPQLLMNWQQLDAVRTELLNGSFDACRPSLKS